MRFTVLFLVVACYPKNNQLILSIVVLANLGEISDYVVLLRWIFSICVFCGEAKTSIDGVKWRDLVMGRWWLVNFVVAGVRCHKRIHV